MDTIYTIVNNNISMLEIAYVSSPTKSDNLFSTNSQESINDSQQQLSENGLGISSIKEKFELPIYNLIIAMATSSIAEDWKPLYALNNVINVCILILNIYINIIFNNKIIYIYINTILLINLLLFLTIKISFWNL